MHRFLWIVAAVCIATALPTAISAAVEAEPALQTPITWAEDFHLIYPGRASYPRVAQLADGTLLATFAHSTPESREIGCVSSGDGGTTWGSYHRILDQNRPVDLDNAFPLQLPDGSILAAYRRHTPGTYRIEVHASVDGGIHWAYRGTLATGHDGLWEPFLLLLPSGVVQAYYASEEGCKPDQRIEMRSSSDGGKTWGSSGSPVTVAQKKGSRDGMPGVVRLDKEELLAVFEAQDEPPYRFVIRGVRSSDNGRTWATTRELIYRPSNPIANRWAAGAPSIICLPDKRLLVSFQSDEQVSYLQGDRDRRRDPAVPGYDYVRHSHFAYVASSDNGRTWIGPSHLLGSPEQPACWNALYGMKDGTILALSNYQGRIWAKAGSFTTFDIKTRKPADQIKVKIDEDSATLDVFSPSGIGGVTITLTRGTWPKTIVLRLHLRGLESFTISNGKIKLRGSVLSHSGNTKRLYLGKEGKGERGERQAETTIKVFNAAGKQIEGLPGEGGYFEITLPKALLEGQPKSLELGWIDFYRG